MNERLVKGFAINFDPDEPECIFSSKAMGESAFLAKVPELAFVGVPGPVVSDVLEQMPGMNPGDSLTVIMCCFSGFGFCAWVNNLLTDFDQALAFILAADESGGIEALLGAAEDCERLNAAESC